MNVRNPTFDDELTMLYGAKFAVAERIKNGGMQYARRLDNDFYFVEWKDIFDYLTNKIDELENERR